MPEREETSGVTTVNRAPTVSRPSPNVRKSITGVISRGFTRNLSFKEIRKSLTFQISLRVVDIRRNIFPSDTTPSAREEALKEPPPKRKKYSLDMRRRTRLIEGFAAFRDSLWEEFFELQTWRITRPYLVLITVIMSLAWLCRVGQNLAEGWSLFHSMLQFLICLTSVTFNMCFLWIDTRYCEPQLKSRDSKTKGLRKTRKYGLIICIAYGFFILIMTTGHVWDFIIKRPTADYRLSWFSMISAFLSIIIVFFRLPMYFTISLLVFVFMVYFVAGYIVDAPYIILPRVLLFELTCAAIVIFTITCVSYRSELISRYIFSKPAQREIQELHASASKRSNVGGGDGTRLSDSSSTRSTRPSSQSLIYGMPLLHHELLLIEAYVGGRYTLYFTDNMEEFAYRNEVFQSIKSSALIYIAGAFMVVVLIIDGCLPLVLVYSATISHDKEVWVLVLRIVPFVVIFICFILAMTRKSFSEPEVPKREHRKVGNESQGSRKTTYERMMIALSLMRLKPHILHMNTALPSALILLYLVYIMFTWDVILQKWDRLPKLENTQYFRLPLVTSLTSCGIMILRLSFAHAMIFVLGVFSVYISILIYLIIDGEFLLLETFNDTKIVIYEIITIAVYCYILLISARKAEFQSRIMYMLQELEMNSTTVLSVYELRRQSERRKIAKEHWSRATIMAARDESADSSTKPAVSQDVEEPSKTSGKEIRPGSPLPLQRTSVSSIKSEFDNTTIVHRQSSSSEAPSTCIRSNFTSSTCLHSNFASSAGRRTTELTSIMSCLNGPPINGGEATISSPSGVLNTAAMMQEDGGGHITTVGGVLVSPSPIVVEELLPEAPMDSESEPIPIQSEVEKGPSFLPLPSFDRGAERGSVTEVENAPARASIPTITFPSIAPDNAPDEDDDNNAYGHDKGMSHKHDNNNRRTNDNESGGIALSIRPDPTSRGSLTIPPTEQFSPSSARCMRASEYTMPSEKAISSPKKMRSLVSDCDDDEGIEDFESLPHQDTRPNQEPGDVESCGDEDDGGMAMFPSLPHVVYLGSEETADGGDNSGQNSREGAPSTSRTVEKRGAIKPSTTMNVVHSSSQCAHHATDDLDGEGRHGHRHTTGSGSHHSMGGEHPPMDDVIPRESSSSGKDSANEIPKEIPPQVVKDAISALPLRYRGPEEADDSRSPYEATDVLKG